MAIEIKTVNTLYTKSMRIFIAKLHTLVPRWSANQRYINNVEDHSRSFMTWALFDAQSKRWNLPAGFAASAAIQRALRVRETALFIAEEATWTPTFITRHPRGFTAGSLFYRSYLKESAYRQSYACVPERYFTNNAWKCVRFAACTTKVPQGDEPRGDAGEKPRGMIAREGGKEWRGGVDYGSWEKAPRLSREKRRAATRLPRGAQRFASLPGSLQALTHQQSLPPPVRLATPLSPPLTNPTLSSPT